MDQNPASVSTCTSGRIQILTPMNSAYLPCLQVLLTSIHINQPAEKIDVWLMHSGIPEESLEPARPGYL